MQRPFLKAIFDLLRWLLHRTGHRVEVPNYFPSGRTDVEAYEYYRDVCRWTYEETGWKKTDDDFLKLLNSAGIDLTGKSLLAVSEGPGFFVKRLEPYTRDVLITEFNPNSVKAMKEVLGVDAVKFDFNSDLLSNVVRGRTFDVILLRSCIAFCNDLDRLACEVRKIANHGATVHVNFHIASLGGCLQWMFDDYTSNYWYTPDTVRKAFESQGFRLLFPQERFRTLTNPKTMYPLGWKQKLFLRPFWWYYFFKSKILSPDFNRGLSETSYDLFFRA